MNFLVIYSKILDSIPELDIEKRNRKEKRMDRKSFVGGSEAAAAMGISRWTSPLALWAEKTGKIEPKDLSDNEAVEMGTELEETVARLFTKKTGMKVRRSPKRYKYYHHEFMQCQVDRLVEGTDELLECKTCSAWLAKEWEGDEIPQDYIIQVMYQLGITGRKVGHIAVLIGGQKFVYKKLEFDSELFAQIEEAVCKFWEMVTSDTPPMALGIDSKFIQKIHPDSDELIQAVEEMNDSIASLQFVKSNIKELTGQKDEIEAKLKLVIGDALGIKTSEYVLTWKTQHGARVDVQLLKDAKIYDQYTVRTKSRVLRVKLNKEKE